MRLGVCIPLDDGQPSESSPQLQLYSNLECGIPCLDNPAAANLTPSSKVRVAHKGSISRLTDNTEAVVGSVWRTKQAVLPGTGVHCVYVNRGLVTDIIGIGEDGKHVFLASKDSGKRKIDTAVPLLQTLIAAAGLLHSDFEFKYHKSATHSLVRQCYYIKKHYTGLEGFETHPSVVDIPPRKCKPMA